MCMSPPSIHFAVGQHPDNSYVFFLTILISDSNSDISDYLRINVHNFDIILISSLLISIIVNYYYQNILFLDIEHMVRNDNIRIIMMSFYHS